MLPSVRMDAPRHLIALILPGSVDAELAGVQAGLFAGHGLSSALAVPPLVPVAFTDAPPRGLLSELDAAVHSPWRMAVRGTMWVDGALFAALDTGGTWEALRLRVIERCGKGTPGLFPAAEGIFLGCGDAAEDLRAAIHPEVSDVSFSSCDIALVDFTTGDAAAWWRELYWEIVEQRPLRGRRKT
jgi:hypothetical protein